MPLIRLRYLLLKIDPASRAAITLPGDPVHSRIDMSVHQREWSLCLLFDSRERLRSSAQTLARAHKRLLALRERLGPAFASR